MLPLLRVRLKSWKFQSQRVMELLEDFLFGKILVDLGLFKYFYHLWLNEVKCQFIVIRFLITFRTNMEHAVLRSDFVARIDFLIIMMAMNFCSVCCLSLKIILNCMSFHDRFLTL